MQFKKEKKTGLKANSGGVFFGVLEISSIDSWQGGMMDLNTECVEM